MNNLYNGNLKPGVVASRIQKALTTATNVGGQLIPELLQEQIVNAIPRMSPELAMVSTKKVSGKTYEYNRLDSLPDFFGPQGESATTPTTQSAGSRQEITLKMIRRKGAVTDFLQDTSERYIDAAAYEMENHVTSQVHMLVNLIVWGNGTANPYEFSGLDPLVVTNRSREVAGGAVPTTLKFLDDMIDNNLDYGGVMHNKCFLMSPYMQSKVSQLLTNVRLQQSLTEKEVKGGWRLSHYRDIPIIPTSGLRPKGTMGALTSATATSGGTIPDATYYFRIAYIDKNGESVASAEKSQTTSGGNTSTLTLSWTAIPGARAFKIYCSTTTGAANTPLCHVIPAYAYDSTGTPSASTSYLVNGKTVTSDANSRVTQVVFTTNPTTASTEVPTALQSDIPYTTAVATPEETVILWDLDEVQGLGLVPYTHNGGSRFDGIIAIERFAKVDFRLDFGLRSDCCLVPAFEKTCYIHRGLRVI